MTASPTHAQLGAALRGISAAARRVGDQSKWRPHPGSESSDVWRAAADTRDPLWVTLVESDVHATLLLRSALAHIDEVGRAVGKRQPFLPLSTGRVALEHSLRCLHLMDVDLTDAERAERRLDELLYAITESDRRRLGFAQRANIDLEQIPDTASTLQEVQERATALGLTITTTSNARRVSALGRPSTMRLAEQYLSGEYPGVLELLLRGHGAIVHGLETALLVSATDTYDPDTGLSMPIPALSEPPVLAFELLGLPPAIDNAFSSIATRFAWPTLGRPWTKYSHERMHLLDVWTRAVNEGTEGDTEPSTIGIFGPT